MPKRFYNLNARKRELAQNRRRAGASPEEEHEIFKGTGRRKARHPPTSFPVFEFLEKELGRKAAGATATFRQKRANGSGVGYVYQRTETGFVLVQRIYFGKDGKETRRESAPLPKNMR